MMVGFEDSDDHCTCYPPTCPQDMKISIVVVPK
jgi:hypothetical protein